MASRSGPLNDDEVISETSKMVAFIRQEAQEKAREIKVKADEEFAVEKAKLVRQETAAIDANFEKKRKGAETSIKIEHSTATNRARLRVLAAREQHLHTLFEDARRQVVLIAQQDEKKYGQLLEGLILEGLLRFLEPSVLVACRPSDVALCKSASQRASASYTSTSGRSVSISVEGSLPKDSAGGVRLAAGSGRIMLDNTLDERLGLLEDSMLPEIRTDLFGKSESRHFYT
ncbi:ATPase V1/A1 complex subunit E [Dacryopinax primogenitus]|uniref:ATPase V1/A1 complex subunit E n=1 Tax=Dacryopinax primogenitus (strain DJM 731) TaxID=1858805 RepID=M5G7B4_DACPD|nr:ATPase V1/A1 complex subunit E [Dacryopinax primogenitus]EJT99657.1 ATPase V1/A1 complex subunit E [Dacryopinax primogenitus]